jgi:hypothetical protein
MGHEGMTALVWFFWMGLVLIAVAMMRSSD